MQLSLGRFSNHRRPRFFEILNYFVQHLLLPKGCFSSSSPNDPKSHKRECAKVVQLFTRFRCFRFRTHVQCAHIHLLFIWPSWHTQFRPRPSNSLGRYTCTFYSIIVCVCVCVYLKLFAAFLSSFKLLTQIDMEGLNRKQQERTKNQ